MGLLLELLQLSILYICLSLLFKPLASLERADQAFLSSQCCCRRMNLRAKKLMGHFWDEFFALLTWTAWVFLREHKDKVGCLQKTPDWKDLFVLFIDMDSKLLPKKKRLYLRIFTTCLKCESAKPPKQLWNFWVSKRNLKSTFWFGFLFPISARCLTCPF